jgi:hypothetical protein
MSDFPIISYNNKCINNTLCTKFLGIMIDDNLTWKVQIDYLAKN